MHAQPQKAVFQRTRPPHCRSRKQLQTQRVRHCRFAARPPQPPNCRRATASVGVPGGSPASWRLMLRMLASSAIMRRSTSLLEHEMAERQWFSSTNGAAQAGLVRHHAAQHIPEGGGIRSSILLRWPNGTIVHVQPPAEEHSQAAQQNGPESRPAEQLSCATPTSATSPPSLEGGIRRQGVEGPCRPRRLCSLPGWQAAGLGQHVEHGAQPAAATGRAGSRRAEGREECLDSGSGKSLPQGMPQAKSFSRCRRLRPSTSTTCRGKLSWQPGSCPSLVTCSYNSSSSSHQNMSSSARYTW